MSHSRVIVNLPNAMLESLREGKDGAKEYTPNFIVANYVQ